MDNPLSDFHGVLWGLKNPGPKYFGTRHNLGAMAVEALATEAEERPDFDRVAKAWSLTRGEHRYLLLVNWVYVNESGAIAEGLVRAGILPQRLLVLVDDLSLPFGSLRLREGGSAGGHNGLKDIERVLGAEYPRLRMGIGPADLAGPPEILLPGAAVPGEVWKEYVLSRFAAEEEKGLPGFLKDAGAAALDFYQGGLLAARNTWNRKGLPKTSI